METEFSDEDLRRLETDVHFTAGFPPEVVSKFRMRMQLIRAASDEREFYQLKSLHFEKLMGNRSHERSMRLNKQWRLIIEIRKGNPKNSVLVKSIEDYH
jgi:toxin HigB-1